MKIYVASSFKNKHMVRKYQRLLEAMGHTIVTDWTVHISTTSLTKLAKDAVIDLEGVHACECLVAVWPGRYGTAGELGAALALKKKVIAVGVPKEERVHWIYMNHPDVIHVRDSIDLLRYLANETIHNANSRDTDS